jgi:general secretion pathway protein G
MTKRAFGIQAKRSRAAGRRGTAAGFTLIELLVVVAIIGILACVAVGQYKHSIRKAKEAVLKEDLFRMRTQISLYFADKGHYPYDLQTLVDDEYLAAIPVDPITQSDDTWVVEYSEQDETDISTEPGIENVSSGAPGVAVDGTNYSDW